MAKRPAKLLMVVIDLDGGVGVFCRNLARGLKRYYPDEFEPKLLMLRAGSDKPADRELFQEIRVIDSPVHGDWRRLLETVPDALRLRKAIAQIDTDLIFAVHNYPSLLVPLVAPDRKVILSVHGHLSTLLRRSVTRPVVRMLVRLRYRGHVVVVPTTGVAEDLARNFGISKTTVIPHGIDVERVQALAAEHVPDVPPQPYMVTLGRLVREKDHATLLRAYAEARTRGLRHRLAIVGGGELEAELKSLASDLGIGPHVHFLGQRANPYPYLKAADFFVLSSITEGFGLALVEALALGLPCISMDCPSGPREILDNGRFGMLVPPASPSNLADAMLKLASTPELRDQLASQARNRANEFSLENMATGYRELFLRCIL